MSDAITAATQYGDFKGTVSMDEAEAGKALRRLARCAPPPAGHLPVAFAVRATAGGSRRELRWTLTVYSVDADAHGTPDAMAAHARGGGSFPVRESMAEIGAAELAEVLLGGIKRLHIVASSRNLRGAPMMLTPET